MVILTLDEASEKIERLQALVRYWKGYPCKFNCRSAKENFAAGYQAAGNEVHEMDPHYVPDSLEKAWTQHQEKEDARTQTSNSE